MVIRRSVSSDTRKVLAAAAAVVVVLSATLALGQNTHPVSGRRIATVMGHEGARWLERPERETEEAPSKAIAALNIRPGHVVADIGAGSGYYTVRLADAVGASGRVYATDIQPEMLALIKERMQAKPLANVELVLGTETDAGCRPAASTWR